MKNIKSLIKNNNKEKNCFTLVELLAVIVVLALLVLIAGRAVTGQITKAKKNTFRTETMQFAKAMASKFEMEEIEGNISTTHFVTEEKNIFYRYACASIESLKEEGYVDYVGEYTGWFEAFRRLGESAYGNNPMITDTDVNPIEIRVIINNGTYAYSFKTLSDIAADKKFATQKLYTELTDAQKGYFSISYCSGGSAPNSFGPPNLTP